MSTHEFVVVLVAILVAAFVQTLAGFGFALLAMPIMTLALPVERAVVVSTILGAMSSGWIALRSRGECDWPLVRRLSYGAYVGMPIGLVVLDTVSDSALRIVLGVAVLVATALLVRRIDLAHVGAAFDASCGFVSGVLNTSLSTNGPPLVFGLQARGVPPERFRSTITMVFLVCNVGGLALFAFDGKFTNDGLAGAALACPAWALGIAAAAPVRRHVHGERFRWMVLGLLAAAGVLAIVAAL